MKRLFFLLLFSSSLAQAQTSDDAFFYVIFSKCLNNTVNFATTASVESEKAGKYNLVCNQLAKKIECKLLDEKGKTEKMDLVTKSSNLAGMTEFKGDAGMHIMVMKSSGGVFFTHTSAASLDTVNELVCSGNIKNASDLKQLEQKKKLLNPAPVKKFVPTPQKPEDASQPLIGE